MIIVNSLRKWAQNRFKKFVLTAVLLLVFADDFTPVLGAEGLTREMEAEFLTKYATLICIRSSYTHLKPAAPKVVKLLEAEAWVFVEKGSLGPEAYERLYKLAKAAGKDTPPSAAFRGCLRWSDDKIIQKIVAGMVSKLRGK